MTTRDQASTAMPPLVLALSMAYVGLLGVISTDFGAHFDEPNLISSLQSSAARGVWLPRWYNYPSVCYDVSVAVAAPHMVLQAARAQGTDQGLHAEALVRYLGGPTFHLRLRAIFFLLSVLSGLAVYLLSRQLAGSDWVALVAGLTSISTWEFVYHARWIAPDCLLASLVAWSALAQYQVLCCERRSRRMFWVVVSGALAGLCIGTKYPGGIVLLPLVLAIALSHERSEPNPSPLLLAAAGLLVAAGAFFLTTPGALLQPSKFLGDVRFEISHYGFGHGGYTVGAGWDHFSKLLLYLASIFLSKNTVLAVIASALAVLGAAHLVRSRLRIGIWFLSLPVFYVLYFSWQRVMLVRNYLLLLPFLAELLGLGLLAVDSAARGRSVLRPLPWAAAAFFIVHNVGIATSSALSIFLPPPTPATTAAASAIDDRLTASPGTRFFLSPACQELLGAAAASPRPNRAETVFLADRLIYLSTEVTDWRLLPANVPGRYRTVWSRVDEVNWDFYPSWGGHARVLEVSAREPEFGPLVADVSRTKVSRGRE